MNAGIRYYTFDNTLQGFYGFSRNYSRKGAATCVNRCTFHGAPCSDLDGRSTGSGNTPKINLQYKIDHDRMVYATYSKGFRPGGVNRNGGGKEPPYKPDYLTNYELGWKTTWIDNRLRWNGAVFYEKWKDFQFSYLGANALTIIANAGEASIKGIETNFEFQVVTGLTLSGGFAYLDPKLTQDFGAHRSHHRVDPRPSSRPRANSCRSRRNSKATSSAATSLTSATSWAMPRPRACMSASGRRSAPAGGATVGPEPAYFQDRFLGGPGEERHDGRALHRQRL